MSITNTSQLLCFYLAASTAFFGFTAADFGAAKSPQQCRADSSEDRADLLSGKEEPYAYVGAPADCRTLGCTHAYWGPKCRYQFEPSCPREARQEMTGWLRYWSDRGAQWAQDVLLLKPCHLWPHLRNRVTWFVGDSMTQDVAYTLQCFMMEYMLPDAPTPDERGPLPKRSPEIMLEIEGDVHNKRSAYWCKGYQEDTTICYLNADYGKRAASVVRFLPRLTSPGDIIVMNIGMHINKIEELKEASDMVSGAIKATRASLPQRLYWKETTPQHYLTGTGMLDMESPIKEQLCHPAGEFYGVNISVNVEGGLEVLQPHHEKARSSGVQELLEGGSRNRITTPAMDRMGLKILPLYNLTLPLWQFHHHIHLPGEGGSCDTVQCDCTHSCAPAWGQLFLGALQRVLVEDESGGGSGGEGGSGGDRSSGGGGNKGHGGGEGFEHSGATHNPMERFANHRKNKRDAQGV